MRASFFGLETALRALLAHQRALDVTGHNIANASTDGYSRQRVNMAPGDPYPATGLGLPAAAGQVGTGVVLTDIVRLRDSFLDRQYGRAVADLAGFRSQLEALEQVEAIFNEPSDESLAATLGKFWAALQGLANDPESLATRATVRESATDAALVINDIHRRLGELRVSLDLAVRDRVTEVNSLAARILDLNQQIRRVQATGEHPNDLEDQRQLLLDRLSELAGVRSLVGSDGALTVWLGSAPLVDGWSWYPLETQDDPANGFLAKVVWKHDGSPALVEGGEFKTLLDVRDTSLPGWIGQVESLAAALRDRLNAVHQAGFGLDGLSGRNLFDPAGGAGSMAVSAEVLADLGALAASATGAVGDGLNALALADVRREALVGGSTVDESWAGLVSEVGVMTAGSAGRVNCGELLVNQTENQRQSAVGVSEDEEMVNLVRYQHGYEAAGRLLQANQEMLDILFRYLA